MSLPKEKFREVLFLLLFAQGEESAPLIMRTLKVSRRYLLQAQEELKEIVAALEEVDALLTRHVTEYELERVQKVEFAILRLATFELLHRPLIPPKVVIAEAIRLTKKFSTPHAVAFVNAVLDGVYRDVGTVSDQSTAS